MIWSGFKKFDKTLSKMKIILAFAALVAVALAQSVPKGDFRSEFDHALVNTGIEFLTRVEYRLLELLTQIAHVEKTKDKAEVQQIVDEIEVALMFARSLEQKVNFELNRTDLNILEQVHFETLKKMCEIITRDLKNAETKVKAIH